MTNRTASQTSRIVALHTKEERMQTQVIHGTSCLQNEVPDVEDPVISLPGISYAEKNSCFCLNKDLLSKHLLLLGGSGCGKTTTFFYLLRDIRRMMDQNDVLIVFDTKGEFYEKFGRPGDIVIGNGKQFYTSSSSWNIFQEVLADGWTERYVTMNAREISSALFADRGSSSQPFFCNAARDIFYALLVHFVRQALYVPEKRMGHLNNADLLRAIRSFTAADYLKIFEAYPDFRYMKTYIGDGKSNQALGVFGELNSMVAEYFVGVLAEHRPNNSVAMRKLVREKGGRAIFLEYDLAIGETLTPMYRLLIDQALKEALGRTTENKEAGEVYLAADEFKLLPKLRHIDDALNFGRGLGVRVIAGIQSIDQLYDIYGEEKGNVIAGGFGSLFAYHTNDSSSREYITRRFGKNFVEETYNNVNGGTVSNSREGNSVEEWDQMELGLGQAVVGLGYSEPFLFQFDNYRG